MNFLILITTLLVMASFQAQQPTLGWAGGLKIEFLPALAAYGALTLSRRWAIIFAVAVGFIQDALSAAPFGISALAYGIVATVLTGLSEVFDRDLPWVQLGAGAVSSAAASFAACAVLGLSGGALGKILALAVLSGAVTPLLFFALDYLRLLGDAS